MRLWLKREREVKNFTQQSIANNVGIERQYYGMIEKGERNPSPKVAKRIAEVLDIDWTLFFEDVGNKVFPPPD
jgi:putative transcriptional regulator